MSTPPPLPPESGAEPPPPSLRLPWEERDRVGLVESFIETIRLLVTEPGDAFGRLRPDGDLTSPMLFGILVSWVSTLFSQGWNILLSQGLRGAFGGNETLEQLFGAPSMLELVGVLLLWPILFVVIVFIGSAIMHACLLVVGGTADSPSGFEGTLKVYVYATVSWLAMIIPFAGSVVGSLWHLVLLVIGFASVHKTTHARAIIAVLIPTIVCCLCVAGSVVFFGALLAPFFEELMSRGGLP